ncbi:MAG: Gfo/Idh/MocA family oxidoreductase [Acidobacteria bacterium]|nr:Gfo/Idh/MocA family oxidoreductase [Acidobacteriota bacterium]MYJ05111.1 Gfo/Idh/MocA family oxidoreductase [Acidobacteriota bacterium]
MSSPLTVAFLGCGFITGVHGGHLRRLRDRFVPAYASRDRVKAEAYRARYGGTAAYGDYRAAIDDPAVDAVVVAMPPRFHLEWTLAALDAGKHVLVEKPAFLRMEDYEQVCASRDRAGRTVIVGENDHYKPLAVCLRRLLADGAIGDLLMAHFTTLVRRLKSAGDWRNDEHAAGGDAFFEEGIHWLHLANCLGPRITTAWGVRPTGGREGSDRRAKSLLAAFRYDNGAGGTLYYSREVPSLLRGLRLSKLFGRDGIISFESNGAAVLVRGRRTRRPELILPGFRDIRGYRAMYRDFADAIASGRPPEMSLEAAMDDQRIMEQIAASADGAEAGEIGDGSRVGVDGR